MKKIITTILTLVIGLTGITAQTYFYEDFENYTVNDFLGNSVGSPWGTWNGAPGTYEDAVVVDDDYSHGKQAIFISDNSSVRGGTPVDLILDLGGQHTTGRFKFTSKWKIPSNTGGYFNFQGGPGLNTHALEVYMYPDGSLQGGKYISASYPQDTWFELVVDIDLDNNVWEMFIDGNSLGTWSNGTNSVAIVDFYAAFGNGETAHWLDEISYCLNDACAADIAFDNVKVSPNPVCTNTPSDVTVTLTNNGPEMSKSVNVGIQLDGQKSVTRKIGIEGLAVGKDTTFTIKGVLVALSSGNGIKISAFNAGGDKDASNDITTSTVDVLEAPAGFEAAQGTLFQGRLNAGDVSSPDLIEVGKTNTYDLIAPSAYPNADYASTWDVAGVTAFTSGGLAVPPSDYIYTPPTPTSNGMISFRGLSKYLDSIIIFTFNVENLPNKCNNVVKRAVRIVPTPKLGLKTPSAICVGDEVLFENTSSIYSGNSTYLWYFGDKDSSDADNPVHIYTKAGTYTVQLFATSHPFDIKADTSITIVVNEVPVVKFKVTNKCEGNPVEFLNQTTIPGNSPITYEWTFGDASPKSTAKDPTHTYTTAAGYRVNLKATSNGCVSTLTKSAYLFAKPNANFTAPVAAVCANSEVVIPNTSTIAYGEHGAIWNFGDGSISTTTNGSHSYNAAGTYTVKLIAVSEFECKDSVEKSVTIKPTPTPDFAGDQFCGKTPTKFTNKTVETVANPTYTWTFSDNYTSNLKNVTRTWPYEGPFTAVLKADYTNGCSGSTTKEFTILIEPKASFSVDDVCSGEMAKFVNKSTGDRSGLVYRWDFGNSTSSTLVSPSALYNPTKTTTYPVTLVVGYPTGCSDTTIQNVTVSEAPVCDFTIKDLGFFNNQFTPTNTSYVKYEWFFGDGGTSVSPTPMYQYEFNALYNVTMRATNLAGCTCETSKKLNVTTDVKSINTLAGVSIYPNPNNGTFVVRNAQSDNMKVEVFTVLGSKIYNQTAADGNLTVSLEGQAKGIYLVKVTINGVTSTSKITVN